MTCNFLFDYSWKCYGQVCGQKSTFCLLHQKTESKTGGAEGLQKYGSLKEHLECLQEKQVIVL